MRRSAFALACCALWACTEAPGSVPTAPPDHETPSPTVLHPAFAGEGPEVAEIGAEPRLGPTAAASLAAPAVGAILAQFLPQAPCALGNGRGMAFDGATLYYTLFTEPPSKRPSWSPGARRGSCSMGSGSHT